MADGVSLWAMAGSGSGEIDDAEAGVQASDLTQQMAGAGVSGTLLSGDRMIAGGTSRLRLKGEVAFTSAYIEGSRTLENASLSTSWQRLMIEGSHTQDLASGATLTPPIEFGLRNVGGDGETGTGLVPTGARVARARDLEFPDRPEVGLQTAGRRCPDGPGLQNVAPATNGVEGRTGEHVGDRPDSSWARLTMDGTAAREEFGTNGGGLGPAIRVLRPRSAPSHDDRSSPGTRRWTTGVGTDPVRAARDRNGPGSSPWPMPR